MHIRIEQHVEGGWEQFAQGIGFSCTTGPHYDNYWKVLKCLQKDRCQLPSLGEAAGRIARFNDSAAENGCETITEETRTTLISVGDARRTLQGMSVGDPEFVALSNALRRYQNGIRWTVDVQVVIEFDHKGDARLRGMCKVCEKTGNERT